MTVDQPTPAEAVPCPTCAARPGNPCMARSPGVSVGFSLAREPHRARIERALGLAPSGEEGGQ